MQEERIKVTVKPEPETPESERLLIAVLKATRRIGLEEERANSRKTDSGNSPTDRGQKSRE
jgi:hypothetical protein